MTVDVGRRMVLPVKCEWCKAIYDLATVGAVRYWLFGRCWVAPCCSREVDDREETGWKSKPDYKRVRRNQIYPCDRCREGLTEYLLCDECRTAATKVARADERSHRG